jgi:hypothetical protein
LRLANAFPPTFSSRAVSTAATRERLIDGTKAIDLPADWCRRGPKALVDTRQPQSTRSKRRQWSGWSVFSALRRVRVCNSF